MSVSSVRPIQRPGLDVSKAAADMDFFKDDPAMRAFFAPVKAEKPVPAMPKAPSPYEVFWALGDDWWKQLYDGKVHKWGPQVFDLGLHKDIPRGGTKEPGFYDSAKAACQMASRPEYLLSEPTVHFYKKVQETACRHFDGKATLVSSDKTGEFGNAREKGCHLDLLSPFIFSDDFDKLQRDYIKYKNCKNIQKQIEYYKAHQQDAVIQQKFEAFIKKFFPNSTKEEVLNDYEKSSDWLKNFEDRLAKKVDEINANIKEKSLLLGLSHPIAILTVESDHILVKYQCSKEEVESTVQAIFKEYNKNMYKAKSQEEKLRLIANLYQMLEWLHPFPDGQGRTDLILLMKELCRHGFTPAILHDPYVSTFATLDDWVEYLKKGMEKWQQEAAKKGFPGTKV